MNKNTKIKIKNRSSSSLSYIIPDSNNFRRFFAAGEVKELPFEEVQKLTYIPGGDYMLQHYLVIDNIEARDEILGAVELEYNYGEKEIKNLLDINVEFSEGWAYGALREGYFGEGMYTSDAIKNWSKKGIVPKKFFNIL